MFCLLLPEEEGLLFCVSLSFFVFLSEGMMQVSLPRFGSFHFTLVFWVGCASPIMPVSQHLGSPGWSIGSSRSSLATS